MFVQEAVDGGAEVAGGWLVPQFLGVNLWPGNAIDKFKLKSVGWRR